MALVAASAFALSHAHFAHAGGRRSVPDLRRDVDARTTPQRIAIPIAIHLTGHVTQYGRTPERVRRWIEGAVVLLQPHGIGLDLLGVDVLDVSSDAYRFRDRRRLARHAPPGKVLHVFVVDRLDRPTRMRRTRPPTVGLYWRSIALGWSQGRHFVVVTIDAPDTTLAHEVGHMLGLRHHPGLKNVMCSCRQGKGISFSPPQATVMRAHARAFVRRRAISGRWTWYRRRLPQ